MALSLKGLFSRKKKARPAEDDGRAPFFTGATLGPGLGNDGDGDGTTRGFDDLLDDEAWGGDDDDDTGRKRPARGGSGRKRVVLFAALGLAAAVIGGGAAWWMLSGGQAPGQVATLLDGDAAESEPAARGEGTPPAEPSAPIGSGERVSLPMPPAPGLEAPRLGTAPAADGDVVVDATAATDRSTARRPWLTEGGAPSTAPSESAAAPATPVEATPAPTAAAPSPAAPAAATEAEPAAAPETTSAPADAPPPPAPPAAVAAEEPEKPDIRTAGNPAPSFDRLTAPPGKPEPLKAAPVSDLVRNTPAGPLPIAAPDGRKAWSTYAKPFNAPAGAPRVAVVVADLGMLPAATEAAITKLPAGVTLAFSPYGFDIPQAMQRAREAGHEVMLVLPMEDRGFPAHDPGPLGLNSLLPANDNLIRLNTILTKGVGYVGVVGRGGATFTAKPELMKPVLETIARAGLLYVQPSGGMQLASYGQIATPTAVVDLTLDERPFRSAIDSRLRALEALAKERGSAIAVISPTPLAFDAVSSWLTEAQTRGIALAPVSAVVRP